MNFSRFRKLDYILFYVIISIIFIIQLYELSLTALVGILIVSIIPTLILGTVTNFIFKKK
ncbi:MULTISPECIES: hypothetical protein [Romboutsia]|uniref:Uncharacterized protein n=1 Tax=Romboutsia ilealis TaxID=1115758 RepID=A0A1V1I1A1_9FIRM|nr:MULTISPECIES: hypothetical protein [Romboutsia]MCI9062104.1 hypothetical protein [Romboutsia sp.]MCI9259737.1 hypothetical protein [Romboutsia sp.]CED93923.1 Hypothetical protein CRIB_1314 [Romboutsia ilealis]